jgi:ABC-type Fe3+ transport system substrate-binding protein
VDQQGQDCLPEAKAFIEYIEGKQAQKQREENAEYPRYPEEKLLHAPAHIGSSLALRPNGMAQRRAGGEMRESL